MKKISPADWARRIKIPLAAWPGNCDGIAWAIVQEGLVPGGVVTRGFWWGVMGGPFVGRPFTGHSWITRPDGSIVDPTRYVFEEERPYIYQGPEDTNYDPGGNRLREGVPCPPHEADETEVTLDFDDVEEANMVRDLLPSDWLADEESTFVDCNGKQAHWLANRPPRLLGLAARPLFRALIKAGYRAHIPIDNQRVVLGPHA